MIRYKNSYRLRSSPVHPTTIYCPLSCTQARNFTPLRACMGPQQERPANRQHIPPATPYKSSSHSIKLLSVARSHMRTPTNTTNVWFQTASSAHTIQHYPMFRLKKKSHIPPPRKTKDPPAPHAPEFPHNSHLMMTSKATSQQTPIIVVLRYFGPPPSRPRWTTPKLLSLLGKGA